MSNILNKLIHRGGNAGLSQTDNNVKMAAIIIGPFLVIWILMQIFMPPQLSSISGAVTLGAWMVILIMLYAKNKISIADYLPFPAAHWRFPDGQQRQFDILIPKNGYEEITKEKQYSDGSRLYRVRFKDKLQYEDPDRQFPDIFNQALWKTPSEWTKTFDRNAEGEIFIGGLFVSHPATENAEFAVVDWDERGSSRIPVCVVTGCSYYYRRILSGQGRELPSTNNTTKDNKNALINELKIKLGKVEKRNEYLELENENYSRQEPSDSIELSDKRVANFFKRHKTIMNAGKKSMLSRLINGKYIALFGILLLVVYLVGKFAVGAW
jgi:hypothetical protein